MERHGYMILYGTQTGTAEDLAEELKEAFETEHINCGCENVFDVDFSLLDEIKHLFVIISTWGDGEPPDDAEDFCAQLESIEENRLQGLEYSVFALGDTGYELFCECGKMVDRQLQHAGATPIIKRVDCDIDIEEPFEQWKKHVVATMRDKQIFAATT